MLVRELIDILETCDRCAEVFIFRNEEESPVRNATIHKSAMITFDSVNKITIEA